MTSWLLSLLVGLTALASSDPAQTEVPTQATAQGTTPQVETGHAAVGALTLWFGLGYRESFCTGTLIQADIVLTAAHCVEDVSPSNTRFYVGNNATNPRSGLSYLAAEFIIHERYAARYLAHDIALVRLQIPVKGVTPIAYNIASLDPHEGRLGVHVGFGAAEGIKESGKGIKRSSTLAITNLKAETFESPYNGASTCFGDSGGPTFLTINNVLSVVGLTSAGAICQGVDCDPCKTPTTSVRVDAYGAWISAKLKELASRAR